LVINRQTTSPYFFEGQTNQTGLANDAAASRFDVPTTILQAPMLAVMPEAALLCYRSGKRIWPI